MESFDPTEQPEPIRPGQDRSGGEADEQAVLDHTRNSVESLSQQFRPLYGAEMGVENEMSAVSHERAVICSSAKRQPAGGARPWAILAITASGALVTAAAIRSARRRRS